MIAWTLLILSGSVILGGLLWLGYTCVREALEGNSEARALLSVVGCMTILVVFVVSLGEVGVFG